MPTGPTTCYVSPDDEITLDEARAQKSPKEKRTALLLTVTPLVITCVAAACMFLIIVRLSVVYPGDEGNSMGGILGGLFGGAVPPRPPQRFAPSRGLTAFDADAAIADISRPTDSPATVCVVCLEDNTVKAVELPCSHIFHETCLTDCMLFDLLSPDVLAHATCGGRRNMIAIT